MFDIYGWDRATGANAANVDDDEEEICEGNDVTVNLGGELVNGPFTEDFVHVMSNAPCSNTVPQQADSALSSSTNKSRKRRSKDKTFERLCLSIGAMADLATTIVPRLVKLINLLSTFDRI